MRRKAITFRKGRKSTARSLTRPRTQPRISTAPSGLRSHPGLNQSFPHAGLEHLGKHGEQIAPTNTVKYTESYHKS